MNGLIKVSHIVKEVLTDIPDTRNSDSYLYLKVLERVAAKQETPINLKEMTVDYFLCNVKQLHFPYFETVRRARQKIQAEHPELKAKAEVEKVRAEKEEVFKAFAVAHNVS
ncbi:MAG: hypothetical protein IKL46_04925 [Clostridia bacterium]|nr:hypothetical protein [Clostridia bacterium]